MLVLTVCNLKGGSGKTTSTAALAAELAVRGRRVLAVDLDPQGSLTMTLGGTPSPSARALLDGGDADLTDNTVEGVDLIGADRALARHERGRAAQVAQRLQGLWQAAGDAYDVALIDPPPASGSLVLGALMASDGVLVPVAVGRGALEGLGDTIQLIEETGTAPVRGTFATRVNVSAGHDRDTVEYLSRQLGALKDGGLALDTFVRETVRVREAEMAGQPVTIYDRSSTAAEDYRAVVDELETHVLKSVAAR